MKIVHKLVSLNWIAVVLFPLAVILMEVFWFYPWLVWIGKWQALVWQRSPLSLASVVFLLGISFLVTRFFLGQNWPTRWKRLTIVSCSLVAIFAVVRVEYGAGFGLLSWQWFVHTAQLFPDTFAHPHPLIIALVAGVYLCWRGISRGHSPLYISDIYTSFLMGIVAFVVLIVSLGAGSLGSSASTVTSCVAAFFFFGLAALILGNLQAIQQKMPPEEITRVFNRRWLPILFVVTGGIVLLGMGIASIFSSEVVAFLGQLLHSTFHLLSQALHYLLIPLVYLATGLFYAVSFIINWLRGEQLPQPFQPPASSEPDELPENVVSQTLPEVAVLVIKWTLFAVIAIAVIFLLVKTISRYRFSKATAEVEEIHESLWSWEGFKADLLLFFSMIWQRFKRKRKKPMPRSPVPRWYTRRKVQGMLGIREIYRYLLWEASRCGIVRHSHETPYEYARRFGQTVPDGSEQVGELTNLYINVRYGDIKAEDKQVDYANNLWKALKRVVDRLKVPR